MSNVQIPQLPPAIGLNGFEEIEIVQEGKSLRATTLQVSLLNVLTIQNNISSNASYYPLYSVITNTKLTPNPILYTSDTHYNYNPMEGRLTAQRVEASQGLFLNSNRLSLDYTIPIGDNAMSMGPVVASAVISIPTGSVWGVI